MSTRGHELAVSNDDVHRVVVTVRPDCFARVFVSRDGRPRLVVAYEGVDIEFVMEDPEDGHEFGVAVAFAALSFGNHCRRAGGGRRA
jgi:hypothetical protein